MVLCINVFLFLGVVNFLKFIRQYVPLISIITYYWCHLMIAQYACTDAVLNENYSIKSCLLIQKYTSI